MVFQNLMSIIIFLTLIKVIFSDPITWQLGQFGSWAKGCDFYANDYKSAIISYDKCAQKCSNTNGCTHYVWSSGTCYLKNGAISQANAIYTNDFSMHCGILRGRF